MHTRVRAPTDTVSNAAISHNGLRCVPDRGTRLLSPPPVPYRSLQNTHTHTRFTHTSFMHAHTRFTHVYTNMLYSRAHTHIRFKMSSYPPIHYSRTEIKRKSRGQSHSTLQSATASRSLSGKATEHSVQSTACRGGHKAAIFASPWRSIVQNHLRSVQLQTLMTSSGKLLYGYKCLIWCPPVNNERDSY